MKILRSITRRGFDVRTAGYFTVLKPNTWFAASRFPANLRHFNVQPEAAPGAQPATVQIMHPEVRNHSWIVTAMIVLAATLLTSALLMWIMHPR